MLCPCGKDATMRTLIYGKGEGKLLCFDCAWDWLKTTSRCPRCSKGVTDCEHRKLALDRGIQPREP